MENFQYTLIHINKIFFKFFKNLPFISEGVTLGFIIISTLFLISFYYIGLKYPDVDLKIKGLGHRSIVTHSFFLTTILMYLHKKNYLWLVYSAKYDITRFMIIGLALGIAIHILYDLRPKAYKGTALIKFPYMNRGLSVNQSIAFMLLTVGVCLFTVIFYVKTLYEMLILLFLLIFTIIKKRKVEKGFWTTIIFFIIIFFSLIYFKPTVIKYWNILMKNFL